MNFSRLTRGTSVLVGCILALAMSSCSMKQDGSSRVSLHIPSAKELGASQKISSMSYSWANACFMVSVTGEGIDATPSNPNTCSVAVGKFAGSVPPEGTLTFDVPRGGNRKLELFVTFTSNGGACPTLKSLSDVSAAKTVLVGHVDSFDTYNQDVSVSVGVSLPADTDNLITQYGLSGCKTTSVYQAGPGSSALVAGHQIQSGGNFKAVSTVSGRQSEKVLSGGAFVMKMTRRPNEE